MNNENSIGKNVFLSKLRRSNITVIFLVLAGMLVIASVSSKYFLDIFNLQSLIRDLAFIGMISIAQSLLLLIGELDLSVGKIASLCGILGGLMMLKAGMNPYVSFVLAVLLGAVLGTINGLIITKLNLNSMVVTIGMTGVYGGINLVITKGKAITGIPENIYFLGKGALFNIPVPFIFCVAVLLIVLFFVNRTHMGRYIYAIGNSKETSKILGIKVNRIRMFLYSIVGAISALAGMLYVARLGSAQSSIGENWPMNSIASAVIGGVALTGGVGNPAGALIGAAIIAVIQNMIVLLGVNVYWQSAVSGFIVVIAISFSSITAMISVRREEIKKVQESKKEQEDK
jgi:ribose transport system permease protein